MPYHNIDAAFRSPKLNECYIFVKEKFIVLNYAPGETKKDVIEAPSLISKGSMIAQIPFVNVIDCAFNAEANDGYIFSGNQCAKMKVAAHSSECSLLTAGNIPIPVMFPCLKDTPLINGIDAAIRSTEKHVFLFKGAEYYVIDFHSEDIISHGSIGNGFRSLVGTVFEYGIDAAFSSHVKDEAYIFKGEYFARINFAPNKTDGDFIVGGRIKLINDVWPALYDILHYYP
ncbi:hypothetical protein RYX36_026398 [Vicia faba]